MSHHPGRPREFTYEKRRELLDHIGQGATAEEAAQIVGVSLRTVQREAKHNEFFDHDLHLALHAAPVDPHKLMLRAARTHWRAAAWLLERTDPDRFAKRPPNSCRPETLMDVSAWLIETALEATPPEHREAVHRRMRGVADKALNVLMPDQHDARRSLVGALPDRPMPLSDHEFAKTLRVVRDRPAPEIGVPPAPAGGSLAAQTPAQSPAKSPAVRPSTHIENFRLLDSEDMDAAWRYPLPTEEDAEVVDSASISATAAISAPQPPASADAPTSPERASAERDQQAQSCGQAPSCGSESASQTTAGLPSSAPPNEGIMSPKVSAATKCDATEFETARGLPTLASHNAGDVIAGLMSA